MTVDDTIYRWNRIDPRPYECQPPPKGKRGTKADPFEYVPSRAEFLALTGRTEDGKLIGWRPQKTEMEPPHGAAYL